MGGDKLDMQDVRIRPIKRSKEIILYFILQSPILNDWLIFDFLTFGRGVGKTPTVCSFYHVNLPLLILSDSINSCIGVPVHPIESEGGNIIQEVRV